MSDGGSYSSHTNPYLDHVLHWRWQLGWLCGPVFFVAFLLLLFRLLIVQFCVQIKMVSLYLEDWIPIFDRTNEHVFASHGLEGALQRPLVAALEQELLLE